MSKLLKKIPYHQTGEGTRRGPEGSSMHSSIGEGRPSDAGPRFVPPVSFVSHQIHVIYEVYCDMQLTRCSHNAVNYTTLGLGGNMRRSNIGVGEQCGAHIYVYIYIYIYISIYIHNSCFQSAARSDPVVLDNVRGSTLGKQLFANICLFIIQSLLFFYFAVFLIFLIVPFSFSVCFFFGLFSFLCISKNNYSIMHTNGLPEYFLRSTSLYMRSAF